MAPRVYRYHTYQPESLSSLRRKTFTPPARTNRAVGIGQVIAQGLPELTNYLDRTFLTRESERMEDQIHERLSQEGPPDPKEGVLLEIVHKRPRVPGELGKQPYSRLSATIAGSGTDPNSVYRNYMRHDRIGQGADSSTFDIGTNYVWVQPDYGSHPELDNIRPELDNITPPWQNLPQSRPGGMDGNANTPF